MAKAPVSIPLAGGQFDAAITNQGTQALLTRLTRVADSTLEREADLIAARSLRSAVARSLSRAPVHSVTPHELSLAAPEVIEGVTSPAVPLEAAVRNYLEPRIGVALDTVRVHTNPMAQRSAAALQARAYAFGQHLVFGQHNYAPHTAAGRSLLAHELAHVAQQGRRGAAFLGRQDWRAPRNPNETVQPLRPGSAIIQRLGPGYLILEDIEIVYLRVEWDPSQPGPKFEFIMTEQPDRQGIGFRLTGDVEVDMSLDRRIEVPAPDAYRLFSYDFNVRGKLEVDGKAVPLPWRFRHLLPPRHYGELPRPITLDPPTEDELDPLRDSRLKLAPRDNRAAEKEREREQDLIRGQPAFKSRAEMEEHIRAHPDDTFIGIETSYGKFVARKIGEQELINLAEEVRGDPDRLPEVAWDVTKKRSAWGVTGVYKRGKLIDPSALHNHYYRHVRSALDGTSLDLEECEVFLMGPGAKSYGRKALSHDEAVKRWSELDRLDRAAIAKLQTEPGRKFVALRARGVGKLHTIDSDYFEGRELFRRRATELRGESSWIDVYRGLTTGEGSGKIIDYVLAEVDREQADPIFTARLHAHEDLAEAVSTLTYDQVVYRAQQVALDAVAQARDQLQPLVENVDRARAFVIGFADMSADEQKKALEFIGAPESDRPFTLEVLRNREKAWALALGLEETRKERESMRVPDDLPSKTRIYYEITRRVSLDHIRGWAAKTIEGLDKATAQLKGERELALWLEGELGTRVREQVYREFGFNLLKPTSFPHREETKGWFPDPLDPGTIAFSSLAEQMFANRVRDEAARSTALKVLKVTLLVVVTVVLILVAQAAGAAIAGLLAAEGSAAFIATELIASGVIFTALSAAQQRLIEGEWQSPLELLGNAVLNIATFGAFRYLNTLLAAGAKSFVAAGVERGAFAAERAGAYATGLRIGALGTTFMLIGVAQRLGSGKGFSSFGDFALFTYENLLMLALLEAGGVLARPLMVRGSIWARDVRLGELQQPITELQGNLLRLQREMASLALRPEAAARDAPKLVERTRSLLERQRSLAEQLRQRFRTRSDAAQLDKRVAAELNAIDNALAGIAQAKFLTELKITPIEGSESVYSYEGGQSAIDKFRKFYGEDKIRVEEDGTLRAEVAGLETRELVFVPAEKYGPAVTPTGPAPKVPPLVQQQLGLLARQQALLRRAKLLGVTHSTLDAIRRKQPTRQTDPKVLKETEALIAKAEAEAGKVMSDLTKNILKNVRDRLGKDAIEQIRAGELRDVTDAELADILWQARGLKDMGVPQLRALVFAARPGTPPISFPRLLQTIRRGRFRVADRNFALETFTQLMELRIPGARQMLADMSASPRKFRGGLFQAEAIRFIGGVERVASIETREPLSNRAREYDITLRDGTRVECKDWQTWQYADSLGDQFVRDITLRTRLSGVQGTEFLNPAGLRNLRYLFRSPPPQSVASIRAFLRGRLERALAGRPEAVRENMLRAFDAHTDMVQAPQLQRSGGVPLPTPSGPQPVPALPDDEEEEGAGAGGDDESESR